MDGKEVRQLSNTGTSDLRVRDNDVKTTLTYLSRRVQQNNHQHDDKESSEQLLLSSGDLAAPKTRFLLEDDVNSQVAHGRLQLESHETLPSPFTTTHPPAHHQVAV